MVATLRPEFLGSFWPTPAFRDADDHELVGPLRSRRSAAVIEGPTELAGIAVEPGLVDRLVADTASGDALPLLAFTLAKLAAGVERGGCLSVERYEQLGGVQGALSAQADAALGAAVAAGGRDRSAVLRELLRLVTVDEQGHPTRRRIAREELPPVVAAELDCFVDRRLLTTDTEDERVTVTVAHEAFLSTWPPLAEAVAAASTALRARRAVEHAAAGWAGTGRPPDRLWERGQLAAAVADVGARLRSVRSAAGVAGRLRSRGAERSSPAGTLVVDRIELSVVAAEFLHASIRRDTRLRRRSVTVLSGCWCSPSPRARSRSSRASPPYGSVTMPSTAG